jgi:hypothetical protein
MIYNISFRCNTLLDIKKIVIIDLDVHQGNGKFFCTVIISCSICPAYSSKPSSYHIRIMNALYS